MKTTLGIGALAGLVIFGARAEGGPDRPVSRAPAKAAAMAPLDWSEFGLVFLGTAPTSAEPEAQPPDVVDAHWMALTMWCEARSDGEAGMRAVGHVIDNRRRVGRHGAFVTETVSEAFQFSCWNAGDPNRDAILNVNALPRDSRDYRLWLTAKIVADEILTGRSHDPTGGALFYHAADISPPWSEGVPPTRQVGRHLFFRTAR